LEKKIPKNNILRWIGSKTHSLEVLERIIKQISERNLIELYCGSSVISINLAKKFDIVTAVDIDENIINFFNYLKENSQNILEFYKEYHDKLKNDTKHYYEVRTEFNKTKDPRFWFALNRTSIGGLMRYNNGNLNMSIHLGRFGTKPKTISKIFDNNIESIRKINFIHRDALEYVDNNFIQNSLIVLDPPYYNTNGMYITNTQNENKLIEIIEKLKNNKIILFYGSQVDDRREIMNKYFCKIIEIGNEKNPGSFLRKIKSNDNTKIKEKVFLNF